MSAEDVRRQYAASFAALKTIQGTYKRCYPVNVFFKDGALPEVKLADEDLFIFDEHKWCEDQTSGARRIDGCFGFRHEGVWIYQDIVLGFDGENYRIYTPAARNGSQGPPGPWVWIYRNPLFLMGDGVLTDPQRDLPDLLDGASIVSELKESDDDVVLRSIVPTPDGGEYQFTAWIDTSRGFMPRRIEIGSPGKELRLVELIADEIQEISPGVWVTTRGRERMYYKKLGFVWKR